MARDENSFEMKLKMKPAQTCGTPIGRHDMRQYVICSLCCAVLLRLNGLTLRFCVRPASWRVNGGHSAAAHVMPGLAPGTSLRMAPKGLPAPEAPRISINLGEASSTVSKALRSLSWAATRFTRSSTESNRFNHDLIRICRDSRPYGLEYPSII